jgi:hypothetical protein
VNPGRQPVHLLRNASAGRRTAVVAEQPQNQSTVPLCPGEPVSWAEFFLGPDFGTINTGDTVVGTAVVSGVLFDTCVVNAPTTGTCTVAPDGSSISFSLANVSSPGPGDLSGLLEVPSNAYGCGPISLTIDLTEPHTFHFVDTAEYACRGLPCPIPATGVAGSAVMALLLAAIAVAVILRKYTTA